MYLSEQAEILIKQDFLGNDCSIGAALEQQRNDGILEVLQTTIDTLHEQLAVKDKQIAELNARLSECSAALVAALQTAQAAQALHAGTIQQQLTGEAADQPQAAPQPPENRKGWFHRIFG